MLDEISLLKGARRFDERELTMIYNQYSPGLYRYAIRLLSDPELAEECVAETFSRFLRALHNGGGPKQHLQAYLYRIAHNWVSDFYRRGRQDALPLDPDGNITDETDLTETVDDQQERERLKAALIHLTPDQRQVIVLKFLEGWTNKEVAVALDKPVGAIKSLQHRALAALKRNLFSQEELAG